MTAIHISDHLCTCHCKEGVHAVSVGCGPDPNATRVSMFGALVQQPLHTADKELSG